MWRASTRGDAQAGCDGRHGLGVLGAVEHLQAVFLRPLPAQLHLPVKILVLASPLKSLSIMVPTTAGPPRGGPVKCSWANIDMEARDGGWAHLRTWGGVSKLALQLMRVPPPSVAPARMLMPAQGSHRSAI